MREGTGRGHVCTVCACERCPGLLLRPQCVRNTVLPTLPPLFPGLDAAPVAVGRQGSSAQTHGGPATSLCISSKGKLGARSACGALTILFGGKKLLALNCLQPRILEPELSAAVSSVKFLPSWGHLWESGPGAPQHFLPSAEDRITAISRPQMSSNVSSRRRPISGMG